MDVEAQNMAVFLGQHADKVLILMQAGFFEMKSGSMRIDFDPQGKIRKVEKTNVFNIG